MTDTSDAALDAQAVLAARIAELEAAVADYQRGQPYRYIGKDGKAVLARELEDDRDALRAQLVTSACRMRLALFHPRGSIGCGQLYPPPSAPLPTHRLRLWWG